MSSLYVKGNTIKGTSSRTIRFDLHLHVQYSCLKPLEKLTSFQIGILYGKYMEFVWKSIIFQTWI